MGMYDNVHVPIDKLPVSDEEKKLIKKENPNWQTKDFDCVLTDIHITDDGFLTIRKFEYGFDKTQKNRFGTMGVLTEENVRTEVIPHHGYFNFYSGVGGQWYDFMAKFTDGKLVSIERVGV